LYHIQNPAIVAMKSDIVTSVILHFENNEKNPPGGAVIQKNQKQMLKS
jgi:hypothetical protein